jgi:excisionase family DNA binding protein
MNLLKTKQVSEKLQISERKVRQLVAAGELAVYRIGGALRFAEEDLLAYVQSCRVQRRERTPRPSTPRLQHLRLS